MIRIYELGKLFKMIFLNNQKFNNLHVELKIVNSMGKATRFPEMEMFPRTHRKQ